MTRTIDADKFLKELATVVAQHEPTSEALENIHTRAFWMAVKAAVNITIIAATRAATTTEGEAA